MPRTVVHDSIDAPLELVFATVSSPERYAEAVPTISNTEFLSDLRQGVGTRFRSTRRMGGKQSDSHDNRQSVTELTITEHVNNERVRLTAESNNTIWETVYSVRRSGYLTVLTVSMEAHTSRLLLRARQRGPLNEA